MRTARAENLAAEDVVFGSMRKKDDARRDRDALGEVDPNAVAQQSAVRASGEGDCEPTEVILYGFGDEMQWSAIDFYERVSNGTIIEDFERAPPGTGPCISRSLSWQKSARHLSKAALAKRNRFRGGNNWIKVTFDSRQAAELAIARSPHIIRGYLVYAEYYQDRGPQKDEPIRATQAGAQLTSDVLPPTLSTNHPTGSPEGWSDTATSATATASGTAPSRSGRPTVTFPWNAPIAQDSPTNSSSTMPSAPPRGDASPPRARTTSFQPSSTALTTTAPPRRGRLEGATRVTVLPAELALAPKQPRASWSSWLGTGEIIGGAVPRGEDGQFDWVRASLYWRLFAWLDYYFGTDFCGLKADE
jgi:hypothetical protein